MKIGFVFSDLHLFANRTDTAVLNSIYNFIPEYANYIVMNGDIFDFEWSHYKNKSETLVQAKSWIEDILNQFETSNIHYIMGNHDCGQDWATILDTIQHPRFQWSPSHFIIDDKLFMHGDLPLGNKKHSPLARQNPKSINPPSYYTILDKTYDLLIKTRIHKAVSKYFSPEKTASLIYNSLEGHHSDLLQNIRHVYFGHTHHPFSSFSYKGKMFYNTGSAIRHMKFNPLEVIHEQE